MRFEQLLGLAAALLTALPAQAADRMVWVEVCDASHPGRRIPLPLDSDRGSPIACHASCTVLPDRRARR